MLASLLTNEVFATAPPIRKRESGIVGGKFLMVAGYAKDLEREKPQEAIAKEIVKQVIKLNLPEETRVEVQQILPWTEPKEADYSLLAADYVAYTRLVDILIAHAQEEEQMALVMAMLMAE